jgi:hypothetical protein
MRKFSTAAVAAVVLLAGSAFAAHNALNGTWTLVPTKSDFAGQPVVQTGAVTISDHEGVIVVTRDFKYEGVGQTFFYSDSSGSEHGSTIHAGDVKSKTKWDDDVLKVTTTTKGSGATVESYRLAADGAMLVNVETPGHKMFTLVFERR